TLANLLGQLGCSFLDAKLQIIAHLPGLALGARPRRVIEHGRTNADYVADAIANQFIVDLQREARTIAAHVVARERRRRLFPLDLALYGSLADLTLILRYEIPNMPVQNVIRGDTQ